jgi:hypothetical protein
MERVKLIGPEGEGDGLGFAAMEDGGAFQGPLQDLHDVIAAEQATEHGHSCEGEALDQDPAKILKVFEKRFYRAALFFRCSVKAFRFGFINHGWNRSAA